MGNHLRKGLGWLIAVAAVGLLSLWLALSLDFVLSGQAQNFQRLGTVAIVTGILLFSTIRSNIDLQPDPDHLKFYFKNYLLARGNLSTDESKPMQDKEIKSVQDGIEKLEFMKKSRWLFFRYEIILVVIGTLQTGYGDVLVNYLHKN